MSKPPVYIDTDATFGYGRNRGFTLGSIGIGPSHDTASPNGIELRFFGRRGASNASVNLTRDDATRLVRQINTALER